ncbi:MAG: hypothetical protein ABJA66_17350 [Actinomycetota bacterium]
MVEIISKTERFLDTGTRIYEFYDEFLVVCPKCGLLAKVLIDGAEFEKLPQRKVYEFKNKFFAQRKLVCLSCLHRDFWSGSQINVGENVDWYFRLPLWLEISCCGELLWAYNLKHLEMLEKYVAAKLRERTKNGRSSFLSKLPKWIKCAKNRDEILKRIAKLKEKLNGKS